MRGGKNKQRILKKLDVFIACEKKKTIEEEKVKIGIINILHKTEYQFECM